MRPGDEVWLKGRLLPGGGLVFSPDGHPEIAVDMSCSYPGEDYRGVDPLEPHSGGEPCELRGTVSFIRESGIVLDVWDERAGNGAGSVFLPFGDPLLREN